MQSSDFLERDNDLAVLTSAYAQACELQGSLVLVIGEAGIGKTRFVRNFADTCPASTHILWGHCDPLTTPAPLAPLYDIARDSGPPLSDMLQTGTGSVVLFGALLEMLRNADQTTVLIIEDIHWADDATLDLIRYLSRRLEGTRALVIATLRNDEVARHEALRFLLGNLTNSRVVKRIELERLSREAVASMAHGRIADTEALFAKTAGNPFYVSEALANPAASIPSSVRDAVLARAASLSPEGCRLLDLVAVLGARVEYSFLERFSSYPVSALGECIGGGILVDAGASLLFRHELARDAVHDAIDPLARRLIYRDVLAEAVAAGLEQREKWAQLAHYTEGAADLDSLFRYSLSAATAAVSLGANREAAAHYAKVVEHSADRPASERATYLSAYADTCTTFQNLDEAIGAYREAARLWREAGDFLREGNALAALAWPLVRTGQNAEANAVTRDAIALVEPGGDSFALANAYRMQAHLYMLDRDRPGALEMGQKAISVSQRVGDKRTLAAAEMVIGAALLVDGDESGKSNLDRCQALAQAHLFDDLVALAYLNAGTAYGETYQFAKAEAELEPGIAFAETRDHLHSRDYMIAWLALCRMYQGRWTESSELAVDLLAQPNLAAVARITALVALARVRIRRGDPGAGVLLDEALALARRTTTLQRLAPVHAARAELAWLNGDAKSACREARTVLELAVEHRHRWHTGEFAYWIRRSGEAFVAPEWIAPPFSLQLNLDWRGAADAWKALGCPYEEARALAGGPVSARIEALERFDAMGAVPEAAQLRQALREEGARGIPKGQRTSTRSNPFGLTTREMEILNHLVGGLSNHRIGEVLFISPKTVDHHVSSILGKLGAANRAEAAEIARTRGLNPTK